MKIFFVVFGFIVFSSCSQKNASIEMPQKHGDRIAFIIDSLNISQYSFRGLAIYGETVWILGINGVFIYSNNLSSI